MIFFNLIVYRYLRMDALIIILFLSNFRSSLQSSSGRRLSSLSSKNEAVIIDQLSKVFGFEKYPAGRGKVINRNRLQKSLPEYMIELYETVAYQDGISKTANPYDADTVRGIPDKANDQQIYYFFNVSHINKGENVLEAEFHLFKLKPSSSISSAAAATAKQRRRRRDLQIIDLRLYQALNHGKEMRDEIRLVHQRRIQAHQPGWEIFKVGDTVRQWISDTNSNYGLLVTVTSASGINETQLRFAQRMENHDSKQPILIVFTNDKKTDIEDQDDEAYKPPISDSNLEVMRKEYIQFLNERYRAGHKTMQIKRRQNYMSPIIHQRLLNETATGTSIKTRRRRTVGHYNQYTRRRRRTCQRQDMYVDFEKIGWAAWIISPKGYNAYHCKGVCSFPLGQNQKPSNHATVQSIIYALKTGTDIDTPCCVPNKLYSTSLLYFDDDENVILKQYDEMVAASCGCH